MGQFLRLLIIFVVAWLLVRLVKNLLLRYRSPTAKNVDSSTPMRQCATCGVFVPDAMALKHANKAFCCEEHQQIGTR